MRRVLVIISLLLVTQLLNAQALHRYVNTTEPCLHILQGHTSRVNSAAFNPDGKRIVSASNDNTIRIWDAMTGECLQILEGHGNNVNSALFSPDGRSIVSASQDENVRIWDAVTGRCRKTLWSSQKGDINVITASFSPDGKRVVWAEFPRYQLYNDADNLICIWDTVTGQCVKAIYLSQKDDIDVMTASFSPDGKRIVSAERPADMYSQADNIIRIWDSTTGRCLHTIKGHIGYINSASYSPNGKYIVSASNDSTINMGFGNWATDWTTDERTYKICQCRFLQPRRQIHRVGITGHDGQNLECRYRTTDWPADDRTYKFRQFCRVQPRRKTHSLGFR